MGIFKFSLKHKIKLHRNSFKPNGKPTVFAMTHVFKDDIASVLYCLRNSAHALGAYHEGLTKTIDGVGVFLNGVIWIDRSDKTSRTESMEKVKTVLSRGGDILIAPEAAWNLSPNVIVQKLWWGLIEAAASTGANIVPVAVDIVGDYYSVIIGENFIPSQYPDKATAIAELRNALATMAWELIELKPKSKRAEMTDDYWVDFTQSELARVPFMDMATEESFMYRPKGEISLGELLADMHGIEHRSMAVDYEQHRRIMRLCDDWNRPVRIR